MKNIGVAELKSRLSYYLKQVQAGRGLIVTDRGQPVAKLVPLDAASTSFDERLAAMVKDGRVTYKYGRKTAKSWPRVDLGPGNIASRMVIEDRE